VYSSFGIVTSKLATHCRTSPSTTTGEALSWAKVLSLVRALAGPFHAPLVWIWWTALAYTLGTVLAVDFTL